MHIIIQKHNLDSYQYFDNENCENCHLILDRLREEPRALEFGLLAKQLVESTIKFGFDPIEPEIAPLGTPEDYETIDWIHEDLEKLTY